MKDLLQQFILIAIIIYCIHMIYYYFKSKNKKYKNVPTIEMNYLTYVYKIDLNKIGVNKVKKNIAFINSIIISIDLLIFNNIESNIIKLSIVFITTILLIFVLYTLLAIVYKRR